MRKILKLVKSSKPDPLIKSQLCLKISYVIANLMKKNAAVTKIQEDPNYFFRYAKKFSICKTDIGPLMNSSINSLSNDEHEMCRLLVD